jgi:hypothetical protein
MKNLNLNFKILIILAAISGLFVACEDAAPFEYIEQHYVEGYLIVDQPIGPINVLKTLPMDQDYDRSEAHLKDAIVTITSDGVYYQLKFVDEPGKDPGFYYDDESILVKPETNYSLKVIDGDKTYTSTTFTPTRISWVAPPKDYIQFPKDTVNLPGNSDYDLAWKKENEAYLEFGYLLAVQHLDTLNYGKYLDPPTQEMNRRNFHPFYNNGNEDGDNNKNVNYYDLSTWNFIANDKSATVWFAFKWFGKQDINVYLPDYNMRQWFIMGFRSSQYDPIFNSIEGGMGCFGSASVVSKTTFLLKNQE